ncbi:MAG: uracil phosphoribosyltransferase [Candidatus Helarchaeota archaeon]
MIKIPFYEFTDKNAIQILATQSRRIDITPYTLTKSHIELGRYLIYQICDEFELEDCKIKHPQGIKTGRKIKNEEDIIILCCMRSGLYLTEGLRTILQNSPTYLINPDKEFGLSDSKYNIFGDLSDKIVIVVDAVINTGATVKKLLDQLSNKNPKKLIVVCLVMPIPTAELFKKNYPDIIFYVARTSNNQYVGRGITDTGNRLFGTFNQEK